VEREHEDRALLGVSSDREDLVRLFTVKKSKGLSVVLIRGKVRQVG
jgi:hypothetical protein